MTTIATMKCLLFARKTKTRVSKRGLKSITIKNVKAVGSRLFKISLNFWF